MLEESEKTVLTKCEYCDYLEEVPLQTLLNLRDLGEDEKINKIEFYVKSVLIICTQ